MSLASTYDQNPGRQYPLVALQTIKEADLIAAGVAAGTGTEIDVAYLPPGSQVLDIKTYVQTAFDVVTPHTAVAVNVGDSTSATAFVNDQSIAAAGLVTPVTTKYGFEYATGTVIQAQVKIDAGATLHSGNEGVLTIAVTYVVDGRAQEVQTDSSDVNNNLA